MCYPRIVALRFHHSSFLLRPSPPVRAHGRYTLYRPWLHACPQIVGPARCCFKTHRRKALQLPPSPRPVRALYFDKSPGANWLVAWHQDLTLAVRTRVEVQGFGPWSIKDGVQHVQPPVGLLEQMLTVRLHLDDCDETNGALRVLPGTHRLGRLDAERIRELREEHSEVVCKVAAGGVLLMRPLLLHASARSQSTRHRRMLHIDYAGFGLPEPLGWYEAS